MVQDAVIRNFGEDLEIVWDMVKNEISELKKQVLKILADTE